MQIYNVLDIAKKMCWLNKFCLRLHPDVNISDFGFSTLRIFDDGNGKVDTLENAENLKPDSKKNGGKKKKT